MDGWMAKRLACCFVGWLVSWLPGWVVGWVGAYLIVLLFAVADTMTNGLKNKEYGNCGQCENQLLEFQKNEITEQNYTRRTSFCISDKW
jgi:uncharacterized membrane protein